MIRLDHVADGHAIAAVTAPFNPATDHVIARIEHGKLLGGVTYTRYNGASIAMHIAAFDPHWINRDMLWVCFHYPFVQLNCKKLLGFVSSRNQKALAFDKHIGFIEEYRIKDASPGGDLVVLSMTAENCRWLKLEPRDLRPGGSI